MKKGLAVVALLLLMAGCNDPSSVKEEFNREGQELTVSVLIVSSESEMKKVVWDYAEGLKGQALYSPDDNSCSIIIYKPKRIDDDATLTLGHELMHCLYGDYHK